MQHLIWPIVPWLVLGGCGGGTPGDVCGDPPLPACPAPGEVYGATEVTPSIVDHVRVGLPDAPSADAFATLGDVDGDGHDDLALTVGDAIWVFGGASLVPDAEDIEPMAIVAVPESTPARAGDVDGDDRADLLVGNGDAWRVFAGARLVEGGTIERGAAIATLRPTEDDRRLLGAEGGGDIDRDGLADVVISEFRPNNRGREEVRLLFGAELSRGGSFAIGDAQAVYGAVVDGDGPSSVAFVGDYDGDGREDVATGSVRNFAAAHAASNIRGSGGFSDKEIHLHDCHPGEERCPSGTRVARAHDVDGDGRDGMLVMGFPEPDAWVIPGADAWELYDFELIGGMHAIRLHLDGVDRITGPGDQDGDGFAEVAGGDGSAEAFVFTGGQLTVAFNAGDDETWPSLSAREATHRLVGFGSGALEVVETGDVSGDGWPDLGLLSADDAQLVIVITPRGP